MLSIIKRILNIKESKIDFEKIVAPMLREGGIGVLPTDTLYGIVGSALSKEAVEKIYKLRKRNKQKPMIILISSMNDLKLFDVEIDSKEKKFLRCVWPGKVSVILKCAGTKFKYLHRGKETLAFRLPKDVWLRDLLKKTGPLVAPSANPEGVKPSSTIKEAKKYFEDKVDFYVDFGKLKSKPSTLVQIENGINVLRKGSVKINLKQC